MTIVNFFLLKSLTDEMHKIISKNFTANAKCAYVRLLSTIINDPLTSNRYGNLAR